MFQQILETLERGWSEPSRHLGEEWSGEMKQQVLQPAVRACPVWLELIEGRIEREKVREAKGG